MRAITVLAFCMALVGVPRIAPGQETITTLGTISGASNTGEKPQSKLWFHAGHWWAVLPSSSVSPSGTWLWRLEANYQWTNVLRLASSTSFKADAVVLGNVTHVLLHSSTSQLVSIQYVPVNDTYTLWSIRPTATSIGLFGSETATIDVDTFGRMWLATESGSNVLVYYSDSPYSTFSGPINLASNINADDITVVGALPVPAPPKIGVLWSNQNTQRFGFRVHLDGAPANVWGADEVPASQSALNIGGGMADDHLNLAVASDGTLYASVKTSYNNSSVPLIALLVRRPNGAWDDLYKVDTSGTRSIVLLNEPRDLIRVLYTSDTSGGDIFYRDSRISAIGFGSRRTLMQGNLNNATSTKANWTDQVAVIASGRGALFRDPRVTTTTSPVTTTTSSSTTSTIPTTTTTTSSSTTTSVPPTTTTTSSSTTTTVSNPTTTTTTTLPPGGVNTYQAGVSGPAGSANVDTYIRLGTPTTNWGTEVNIYVGVTNGPDKVFRPVMAFNLAGIPAGAVVTQCRLTVNVTQRTNPTPGHVRRLCGEHWLDGDGQSEAQATWNSWKTGTAWGAAGASSTAACTAGGDYTTAGELTYVPPAGTGPFTFPDLSALCNDALTLRGGWLRLRISQDAENTQSNLFNFDSSDATTATNRPKLVVTWSQP